VIKSIWDSPTRQFIQTGKCKFSGLDTELAYQRLNELNAATDLASFGKLNSVHLHKLTHGRAKGFWSIDINDPWRLLFKFKRGDAYEVHIADTHD
jgi:proteic killer suppression protein